MTFEKYIPMEWPRYSELYVSIRAKGCIAIHDPDRFPANSGPSPGTRVTLFYSTKREVIGIKPINDQCEYSPILISGEPEIPLIHCKPFLDHYKIPYPYYPWPGEAAIWNHEAGMLMIRLI